MRWRVAGASEYLVITGVGIADIKLAKKAWVMPGQKSTLFDITPVNYEFDVQAMSAEKLPFLLPAVFTIGPKLEPDMEPLEKYAKLVAPLRKNQAGHVKEIVRGIIEGETRVLAAGMTMEEIFKGTKQFKQEVFDKVQLELNAFGLHIYNANVKQLVDVVGHEYFSYLGQKIQQEAANTAKVAVAEAQYKGNVGAKEREGLTTQNAAKVDAETKVFATKQAAIAKQQELKAQAETKVYENTRKAEVAQADSELAKKSAQWTQEAEVAKIQGAKAAAIKEAELQREVELRRAQAETERLRASQLAPAVIRYETTVQEAQAALFERQRAADAELFEKQRAADALTYESQRAADAQRQAADAGAYATIKDADARLYAAQKEAEGIVAIAEAKADFLNKLLAQLDGNYSALHDFLLLDRGIYQDMGRINADAIRGLNPKISIWTTGSNGVPDQINIGDGAGTSHGAGALSQLSNIYKAIPPLLTTVQDQTGVTPLPFLAALPAGTTAS